MNIEAPVLTQTTETKQKQTTNSTSTSQADGGKSFKDELVSVATQEDNKTSDANIESSSSNDLTTNKNNSENNASASTSSDSVQQKTIEDNDLTSQNKQTLTEKGKADDTLKATISTVKKDEISNKISDTTQQDATDSVDLLLQQQVQAAQAAQANLTNKNTQVTAKAEQSSTDLKSKKVSWLASKVSTAEEALNPVEELKSKIETIKNLKSASLESAEKFTTSKTDVETSYSAINMTQSDALFFANLVKSEQYAVSQQGGVTGAAAEITNEATNETVQVSATLMDTINQAAKTNQPFRIDFDKDVAVIMKIDKQGKLTAEFIPGDKAVETYLKNNIGLLQATFDEQKLPYNELTYRRQKQDQQNNDKNNNQKNKENDDE